MHALHEEPFPAGTVLGGKYRVDRLLGRGGMGMVVAALNLDLDQRVALKFILADVARRPLLVERFLREARAAGKLRSEHVAKVFDVGRLPGSEEGLPFIVMELLEGRDLRAHLAERGALPVPVAVDYVLQAIDAVAEAHRLGIVHRDLKPANLFLSMHGEGEPIVKLLDFGISKAQGSIDESGDRMAITATSAFLGSPAYASPEQCRSPRDVDGRSDIWSLGAILYELLTAARPFQAQSEAEMIAAVLMKEPRPMHTLVAGLPKGLEDAVLRCLRKDPAERFPTVAALAVAIAPYGTGHWNRCVERAVRLVGAPPVAQQLATSPGPSLGSVTAVSGIITSATQEARRRSLSVIVAILAGVAVALCCAAVVALVWVRHRGSAPQVISAPSSSPVQSVQSEPDVAPEPVLALQPDPTLTKEAPVAKPVTVREKAPPKEKAASRARDKGASSADAKPSATAEVDAGSPRCSGVFCDRH